MEITKKKIENLFNTLLEIYITNKMYPYKLKLVGFGSNSEVNIVKNPEDLLSRIKSLMVLLSIGNFKAEFNGKIYYYNELKGDICGN